MYMVVTTEGFPDGEVRGEIIEHVVASVGPEPESARKPKHAASRMQFINVRWAGEESPVGIELSADTTGLGRTYVQPPMRRADFPLFVRSLRYVLQGSERMRVELKMGNYSQYHIDR
jgi:hypothetical protein